MPLMICFKKDDEDKGKIVYFPNFKIGPLDDVIKDLISAVAEDMHAFEHVMNNFPLNSEPSKLPLSDNSDIDDNAGYIFVPSLGVYISEKTYFPGKSWNETNAILHSVDKRMPTIPEIIEFTKYLQSDCGKLKVPNANSILDSMYIRQNNEGNRTCEWLDARFEVNPELIRYDPDSIQQCKNNEDLIVNSFAFLHEPSLIFLNRQNLDSHLIYDTLKSNSEHPIDYAPDIFSGIELKDWLTNPTKQGLPKPDCRDMNHTPSIYYGSPKAGKVAGLYGYAGKVGLDCQLNPEDTSTTPRTRVVSQTPD